MSAEGSLPCSELVHQTLDIQNTDANNNEDFIRSVSDPYNLPTSPTSSDDPLRILNRGPDYLRTRLFNRQSGFERLTPQKSAVDLLKESKSYFLQRMVSESGASVSSLMMTSPDNKLLTTNAPVFRSYNSTDMNCETHLIDSMMTKLYIPRNDSLDGKTETSHPPPPLPPLPPPPPPSRFVTCGKRRLCTKVKDPYDGLKQRQRLASAEAGLDAGYSKIVKDTDTGVKEAIEGTGFIHPLPISSFNHDRNQWPVSDSPHLQCGPVVSRGNEPYWNKIDFSSSSSSSPRSPILPAAVCDRAVKLENCSTSENNDSKIECDSYVYNRLTSDVENMDMQSKARNQRNDTGTSFPDRKTNYEEEEKEITDLYEHFRLGLCAEAAMVSSVSNWRDTQMENSDVDQQTPATNARADDGGRGTRAFRRYKKVVTKSGSKPSDLTNRFSNGSETMKTLGARNGGDLEVFFSEMGMEKSGVASDVGQLDCTHSSTSLNVLENISSIGTPLDSRSCTSRESHHHHHHVDDSLLRSLDLEEKPGLSMSVVERNARIIKWLFNIRRVSNLADEIDE